MNISAIELINSIAADRVSFDYDNVELDRIQAALMSGDLMDEHFGGKDLIYIRTEGASDDGRIAVIEEAYDIVTRWMKDGLTTLSQTTKSIC